MILALLDKLTSDPVLSSLLVATNTDSKIHPVHVEGFGPAIAYTVTPVIREGNVVTDRVELRVVAPTYAGALLIANRLVNLLDLDEQTAGWWYDTTYVLSSNLNGGGSLEFGDNAYEEFRFFDVKWREA